MRTNLNAEVAADAYSSDGSATRRMIALMAQTRIQNFAVSSLRHMVLHKWRMTAWMKVEQNNSEVFMTTNAPKFESSLELKPKNVPNTHWLRICIVALMHVPCYLRGNFQWYTHTHSTPPEMQICPRLVNFVTISLEYSDGIAMQWH